MLSRPLAVNEAWAAYQRYRAQPGVSYLSDTDAADTVFKELTCRAYWKHHLWTDAYLAALALRFEARLVSFDADFGHFSGLHCLQLTP